MTDDEKNLKDLASDLHTSLCEGSDLSEHGCVTEEILDVLKVAFDLGKESKIGILKFRVEQEVLKLEKENAELKAQLAEGEPKWHDLRKDPNDLPKESGNYWGYVNYYGFQHRTLYWSDNQFDVSEVIAWCELPKFEEPDR